jgi:hypothetical protein
MLEFRRQTSGESAIEARKANLSRDKRTLKGIRVDMQMVMDWFTEGSNAVDHARYHVCPLRHAASVSEETGIISNASTTVPIGQRPRNIHHRVISSKQLAATADQFLSS